MSITLSNRSITTSMAALLIAVPAGIAIGTGTSPDAVSRAHAAAAAPATSAALAAAPRTLSHAAAITVRQQAAVTRYWTPARMRSATRDAWLDGDSLGKGLRWVHGGTVARTTGKVFFTLNHADYVCSGAAVGGGGHDVVLTAAHCTGDGPGGWASNWTFVPGYTDGTAPSGSYSARRFYVLTRWADRRGVSARNAERYDIAFVTVNRSGPAGRSGTGGRRLGQVAPGQAVAFAGALNGRDTYVFGYPSDPPFSGLYPNYCAGPARQTAREAANGTASVDCGMTAGDSGGPWITRFSPRTGTGVIVAVTTYRYSGGSALLYGTQLGSGARTLYETAIGADDGRARAPAYWRANAPDYRRG